MDNAELGHILPVLWFLDARQETTENIVELVKKSYPGHYEKYHLTQARGADG